MEGSLFGFSPADAIVFLLILNWRKGKELRQKYYKDDNRFSALCGKHFVGKLYFITGKFRSEKSGKPTFSSNYFDEYDTVRRLFFKTYGCPDAGGVVFYIVRSFKFAFALWCANGGGAGE